MRVSILTPTHNRPKYLARALRSVLSQTHPDWEALVVDDGDGQGIKAALAMSDPRIKPGPNDGEGQVDARNTALKRATGDVIALLGPTGCRERCAQQLAVALAQEREARAAAGAIDCRAWRTGSAA